MFPSDCHKADLITSGLLRMSYFSDLLYSLNCVAGWLCTKQSGREEKENLCCILIDNGFRGSWWSLRCTMGKRKKRRRKNTRHCMYDLQLALYWAVMYLLNLEMFSGLEVLAVELGTSNYSLQSPICTVHELHDYISVTCSTLSPFPAYPFYLPPPPPPISP